MHKILALPPKFINTLTGNEKSLFLNSKGKQRISNYQNATKLSYLKFKLAIN